MPAVEEPIIVIPSSSSEELGEAGGRGRGGGRGGGGAGTREKSEAGTPNNKSSASVRPRQSTSNNNNKKKKTMGKKLKNTEEEEEEDGNEVESSVKKAAASSSSSSSPASLGAGGVPNGLSSSCSFPMSRVRRLVVGSDGARRGAAIRPTHETVFLANKAAELFLELFAEDAYKCARRERKKHLSYKHLSTNVKAKKKYEFLSDFVPDKLKDEDALKAREMVEL